MGSWEYRFLVVRGGRALPKLLVYHEGLTILTGAVFSRRSTEGLTYGYRTHTIVTVLPCEATTSVLAVSGCSRDMDTRLESRASVVQQTIGVTSYNFSVFWGYSEGFVSETRRELARTVCRDKDAAFSDYDCH